jgi:hypothetical protein
MLFNVSGSNAVDIMVVLYLIKIQIYFCKQQWENKRFLFFVSFSLSVSFACVVFFSRDFGCASSCSDVEPSK